MAGNTFGSLFRVTTFGESHGPAVGVIGGDVQAVRELAEVFRDDATALLTEIRTALAAGEARKLGRAAHTLKGMVSFIAAATATEAAFQLETMGDAGDLASAAPALATLERELDVIQAGLASVCS